jgi:hypothetical protein
VEAFLFDTDNLQSAEDAAADNLSLVEASLPLGVVLLNALISALFS